MDSPYAKSNLSTLMVSAADVRMSVDVTGGHKGSTTTPKGVLNNTPKSGRIALTKGDLAKMNSRVAKKLTQLDLNHDGEISAFELAEAMEQLIKEEAKHRQYKYIAIAVISLLILGLAANLGLAYAVAVLSKETTVMDDVMYSTQTNRPVEVESAHFTVRDGILTSRRTQDDGAPIATSASTEIDIIAHDYSDDHLGNLERIRFFDNATGAVASLSVLGFVRAPAAAPRTAMVGLEATKATDLAILTSAGVVSYAANGQVSVDQQLGSFLSAAGFPASNATAAAGRRLLFNFDEKCNKADGRICGSVDGQYRTDRKVTCKYGDTQNGRLSTIYGENCSKFCTGFNATFGNTLAMAVCFEPYKLTQNGPALIFPCENELQCVKTSRGCAPSFDTYCCCYDSQNRVASDVIRVERDAPGSQSYGR